MEEATRIENLRVRYPGAAAATLDGISLQLSAGERLGLLGNNGSGKTTFAHSLIGIVPEFFRAEVAGRIRVGGDALEGLSIQRRLGRVSYSFQDVDSQVLFGNVGEILGLAEARTHRDLMEEAIVVLGLEPLLDRLPSQLSGGQAQRLALAAALRRGPDLILYDEATTALDPLARDRFGVLVDGLSRRGHALILIGQRARMLEPYSHRLATLAAGRLCEGKADTPATAAQRCAWDDLWDRLDDPRHQSSPVGLVLNGVRCRYRGADGFSFGPLTTEVKPGEVVALVGANGSGKSTLFRLIVGALRVRQGKMSFPLPDGRVIKHLREVSVGALFQNPSVQLIGSTVAEELAEGLKRHGSPAPADLMDTVIGAFPFLRPERDPLELSYGQQKLLCLLGLAVGCYGLILLDEPEQGLDECHLDLLRGWIDRLRKRRRQTLLFATHDMELAANSSDRVLLFSRGGLAADFRRPGLAELTASFRGS